jgi:hypothetical protein
MNKQIVDLLMWKAGARFEMMNWVDYEKFDYEKFAQLIVKECVAICEDMDGVDDFEQHMNPKTSRYDCAIEIKEHFGVE